VSEEACWEMVGGGGCFIFWMYFFLPILKDYPDIVMAPDSTPPHVCVSISWNYTNHVCFSYIQLERIKGINNNIRIPKTRCVKGEEGERTLNSLLEYLEGLLRNLKDVDIAKSVDDDMPRLLHDLRPIQL
jgi:hypothetical protein